MCAIGRVSGAEVRFPMLTNGLVEVAIWKTDLSLVVTSAAGTTRKLGLRRGGHVTAAEAEAPRLADSFGTAHALALSGGTVSWQVPDATHLWMVMLSPDLTPDGAVCGVIGTAWQLPMGGDNASTVPAVEFPRPVPGTCRDDGEAPAPDPVQADVLLRDLPVPVLKVSSGLRVVGLNPAAADLFGCRPDEDLGRPALSDLMRDGVPPPAAEPRPVGFVRRDGSAFRASCTRIPWPHGDGAAELVVLHGEIAPAAAAEIQGPAARPALTPTETTILELTAQGLTSTQIAKRLHFSTNNVEYHLANLRIRMGGVNRVALVARAYVWGLLQRGAWPPAAVVTSADAEAA
ncbi:helix-turn-helix transcriptional regulator [Streptomyces sp. NPDC087212]|uniref:helix-turn-helix transcriptional regulator n=2 Tax=unclassified Streptomyces TaxID=2593676 RepID=UPI00381AF62A